MLSKPIAASRGVPSRSSSFLTVLSSNFRRLAIPIPAPKPKSKPSAKFIDFLGAEGAPAGVARFTVETLTGESTPIPCNSSSLTVKAN